MIIKSIIKGPVRFCLLVLFASLFACIESYSPELEEENVLVVDGMINNLPGPYTIRLNFSSDPYRLTTSAVTGASISIIEEDGIEEELSEVAEGVYETSATGIQGVAGRKYKISIQTTAGKIYESPFQLLREAPPIGSVDAEVEVRFFESTEIETPGYQFYLNTSPPETEQDYFLWLQKGTYKYVSPYILAYIYDGELTPVDDPFEFKTCYGTHVVNQVVTLSTKNLGNDLIRKIPLSFLRADTRFLSTRYSLLVEQHIVSKETYTYWNNIEKQVDALGSLYATQPFQIKGNITNIDDPDEEILGYFVVAVE